MCEHARSLEFKPGSAEPKALHVPVFTGLRQLFGKLQSSILPRGQHTQEHIRDISLLLERTPLSKEEWGPFANWSESRYTRNLIANDVNFTVLLLCWSKGQRSPIHDHAGSSCWVKLLDGKMAERRFRPVDGGDGSLVEFSNVTLETGGVCYINDSHGLHDMGATEDGPCVSLHVYCPPYHYCNAYSMDGSKRQVSMIAATAPRRDVCPITPPPGLAMTFPSVAPETAPARVDHHPPESLLSIRDLIDVMDSKIATKEDVVAAFDKTSISSAEWSAYAHFSDIRFQRLLMHSNEKYSLLMLTWLPGQATPPHDHEGSESWVKLLSGELTLTICKDGLPDAAVPETRIVEASATFRESSELPQHIMGNKGTSFAISLHLYAPPYTEMHYTTNSTTEAAGSGKGDGCDCCAKPEVRCVPSSQCQQLKCRLSNVGALLAGLDGTFGCPCTCCGEAARAESILEMLETFHICPVEIDRYWQQRSRYGECIQIAETPKYNVVLNMWAPGHGSVAHDHDGSTAFVKVLKGVVVDVSYNIASGSIPTLARTTRMREGQVCFLAKEGVHAMRNASNLEPAVTLHVYGRVCHSCRWFSLNVPTKPISVSAIAQAGRHEIDELDVGGGI